jgi:hypothetical protein
LKGKESVIFVEGDEQRMMLMGLRPQIYKYKYCRFKRNTSKLVAENEYCFKQKR